MSDELAPTRATLEKLYAEHRVHLRHIETLRSGVLTFLGTVSGAILGFAAKDGLRPDDKWMGAVVFGLGTFALLLSAKLHEKLKLEIRRADGMVRAIDQTLPGSPLSAIYDEMNANHDSAFPMLRRLKMWAVWGGLAGVLCFVGGVVFFLAG
jgi:hypothetical protein